MNFYLFGLEGRGGEVFLVEVRKKFKDGGD